jgi:pyruvate dehydrogenase E2 component (dihydrolipoamide acetyltransferase)
MPRLGMTMEEGRVVEWVISPGEHVEKGATVLIIESEKAEVEVEATAPGVLRHVYVDPDETVPCGTLLGALTDSADEDFDADGFGREHTLEAPGDAEAQDASPTPLAAPREHRSEGGRTSATPAARRRAKDLGVDLASLAGTGPRGRVTVEDVESAADGERTRAGGANRVQVAAGVSLDVPRQGSGDPLLLLPGFGTDVSVFSQQVPPLAARFEVFGVNPRGVGASDQPEDEAYDPAQAADDAASLVSQPAHVVGTSLGAAVALELALRHPELVRSLSLVAPLSGASGRLVAVTEAWCRLAADAGPEALAAALLPWFFAPSSLADAKLRERMRRGLAATLSRVSPLTLERQAAGLRGWQPDDAALAGLDVPTLVIAASDDLLTPDGEALARRIPGARSVLVPEAGHAVGLEAPETVNAALEEHLKGIA